MSLRDSLRSPLTASLATKVRRVVRGGRSCAFLTGSSRLSRVAGWTSCRNSVIAVASGGVLGLGELVPPAGPVGDGKKQPILAREHVRVAGRCWNPEVAGAVGVVGQPEEVADPVAAVGAIADGSHEIARQKSEPGRPGQSADVRGVPVSAR